MRLESAHISNFRLLEDVSLSFSTDEKRPLTVIRAENGSGKTSILYALRWAMYGERGIPARMRLTSTGRPAGAPVTVQVRLEFTTVDPFSKAEARYRLIRSCEETPGEEDLYNRSQERVRLLRRTDRGEEDIDVGMEGILNAVLPLNLVEVFFTNGDDVQSFIAGGRHGQRERQEAVHDAIRRLLGLEDVETVAGLFSSAVRRLRRESAAAGGNELQEAEDELETLYADLTTENEKLAQVHRRRDLVDEQIRQDERELDAIKGLGDLDAIQVRIRKLEQDIAHLESQEAAIRQQMKDFLRSDHVSQEFMQPQLQNGLAVLGELVDRKIIPGTALEVLVDRMHLGICICGEDLTPGNERHTHVADLIEEQGRIAPRLQRLTALFHEARNTLETTQSEDDEERSLSRTASSLTSQLSECRDLHRRKQSDLDAEREKRNQIDDSLVQSLTDRLNSNRSRRSDFEREDGQVTAAIQEIQARLVGCERRFEELKSKANLNRTLKLQSDVAQDFLKLTEGTLNRLKSTYVSRVSERMNSLFMEIAGSDPSSDLTPFKEVFIDSTSYDIIVRSLEDTTLDADTEVNGANQRGLTLSFIWALMEVAEREAPRIIDTPLGMTSGSLKSRMVDLLTRPTEQAGVPYQAILFMTRSEIRDIEQLITERAGIIRTLTCSKDYPIDLVNDWSEGNLTVKACPCKHTEVCFVCERRSDAGRFQYREAVNDK